MAVDWSNPKAWTREQAAEAYAGAKAQGWDEKRIAQWAKDNEVSLDNQAGAAYDYGAKAGGSSTAGAAQAMGLLQAGDPTGKSVYDAAQKFGVTDTAIADAINYSDQGNQFKDWDAKGVDDYAIAQGWRGSKPQFNVAPTYEAPSYATYTANTATATPAKTSTYVAQTREIDPTQETVEGRMERLLDPNNKLTTMARNQAQVAAGRRGMQNSSIASSGGLQAAYQFAMPIASQDAGTYFTQGRDNQQAINTQRQFNASAENQGSQFNAGLLTANSQFNAGARNQAAAQGAQAMNAASMAGFDAQQRQREAQILRDWTTRERTATEQWKSGEAAQDRGVQLQIAKENTAAANAQSAAAREQAAQIANAQIAQSGMALNQQSRQSYTSTFSAIIGSDMPADVKTLAVNRLNALYGMPTDFKLPDAPATNLNNPNVKLTDLAPGSTVNFNGISGKFNYDTAGKPILVATDGTVYDIQPNTTAPTTPATGA